MSFSSEDRRVRLLTEDDLGMLLSWRNHIDVRRFMYTQHEISIQEHTNWFESVKDNPQKCLLICEQNHQPFAFGSLSILGHGKIADWGFYAAPHAPRGMGSHLAGGILEHAFNVLHLNKLCSEALAYNEKSIKFQEGLGFSREGLLRGQHYDGSDFIDVIRFGLLHAEWKQNSEGLK